MSKLEMENDVSIQEILKYPNKEFMKEFRDWIYHIMKKADLYRNLFVAYTNEYFNELEKRLDD